MAIVWSRNGGVGTASSHRSGLAPNKSANVSQPVSTMSIFLLGSSNYPDMHFLYCKSEVFDFQNLAGSRQFSTSPVMLARQHKSKINVPSKKVLAAKAKRRAAKVPKHIYHKEQMPLTDAVAVLRVGAFGVDYTRGLFN